MPLPTKPFRVPPLTVTSSAVKSVEASDSVKVMRAVSSMPKVRSSLAMVNVGGASVFTSRVTEAPVVLGLSAVSVKTPAVTVMIPSSVLSAVGVKVAV